MAEWWEAAPLAAEGTTPASPSNPAAASSWWANAPIAPPEPSFWERAMGRQPGPLIPSATPDQASFLPIRRTPQGPEFDYSAGVLGSLLRGLTTVGDVGTGRIATPYGGQNAAAQPSPDLMSRAGEAAGLMSPISPSYRAGARFGTVTPPANDAWLSSLRGNLTKPLLDAPPTKDILKAADAGYNAVRDSGWEVPSTSVSDLANTAITQLGNRFTPPGTGYAGTAPGTYARLNAMANPNRGSTSISDLMSHREALTGTINAGGSDSVAARTVRDQLDNMIANLGDAGARPIADPLRPGVGPTMSLEDIASTLQDARANTRSARTANRLSGDLDPAIKGILDEVQLKADASGNYNIDQSLRGRAAAILARNKDVASLLPDEKDALEAVVRGTVTQNSLRLLGKRFAPNSMFNITLSGGAGYGAGSLLGLPPELLALGVPAAGAAAQSANIAMTKSGLRAAEEQVRRNSPFHQGLLADATLSYVPGLGRDETVMRALLGGGLLAPAPPEQGLLSERRMPPGFI